MANRKQRRAAGRVARRSTSSSTSGPILKQPELTIRCLPKEPLAEEMEQLANLFNRCCYAEAESLAREMTKNFPDHAFGWKVLGAVYGQQGNTSESLLSMQKAVTLAPREAEIHSNLGSTLRDLGRLEEAEASCRKALEIKPDYAVAYINLGCILRDLERLDEAEVQYRKALEIKPDYAVAHSNLGNTLRELGRLKEAETHYHQALALKPDYAEVYSNLGNLLRDFERLTEAEASYRRALQLKPNYAEAHNNFGSTLADLGRLEEAEASYRRALELKPDYAEAYSNLGNTLAELGRFEEAEACYRRALELKPDYVEALLNLGSTLTDFGLLEEAETLYRRALELKPDHAKLHSNFGNTLAELGRFEEAEASYRRALELKPDYTEAYSNLLFTFNYMPNRTPSEYLNEARHYGQLIDSKVGQRFLRWNCVLLPERLRVGLVSGDLNIHPVGFFLENVLSYLDKSRIELFAYSTSVKMDELTNRVRPYFSHWKSLVGINDKVAAELIHADGVHVLLDLSGHTAKNRLPLFAWKPAPMQASWLGYFATTGVAEMDYIIGDPYNTPTEEEWQFTEVVWRLPETSLCFTPPDAIIDVGPLPALAKGHVTFGCFNNLSKLNDSVVRLWSKILKAVPDSRLFIKAKQLGDSTICETVQRQFAKHGIPPNRLLFEKGSSRLEYLSRYNLIDIALDPFPFPGGTTSAECLWMGVPVLTKRGDCFLSHQGETILANAGLTEWIADNDEDYVTKAVQYASNLNTLSSLRAGLRKQILASPLFDAQRFAKNLELALWSLWQNRFTH